MSRINDVIQIIYEITGETPKVAKRNTQHSYAGEDYSIIIVPIPLESQDPYMDHDFFQVVIFSELIATLETKRLLLLKIDTLHPEGYKYTDRVYFTVDSATEFSVGETLTDQTSGATGTIYQISTNTVYLKNVNGTFGNGNTVTDGSNPTTITSDQVALTFPEYFGILQRDKDPDNKWFTFLLDARWQI